jgi:NAD(P)-dependent dehydrogenase (short-subunit alcohol dehydrogenase family)
MTEGGRLQGRVAIVTGASRGIGAGLARAIAAEGAAVAVAARSEQQWHEKLPGTIHETVAAIEDAGGTAVPIRCDLTVEDDLVHLVETATRELGTVDLLVNNAAVTAPGRPPAAGAPAPTPPAPSTPRPAAAPAPAAPRPGFLGFPVKGYRLHFEVDVFAAYRLMQLVAPGMIELGRGTILNISSDASQRPGEGPYPDAGGTTTFAYGGAKAALEHLTQAVAFELQPFGIAVNALSPSLPVETPGLRFMGPARGPESPMADFCEAAVRLLLADPAVTTGWRHYSQDVLEPELGRRRWLGGP